MNLAEKLEIAQALVDLGVDVIEAGFPIASPGDFEAVREIARRSAARRSAAWPAATTPTSTAPGRRSRTRPQPRIHVFLATSAIHREFKLKMTRRRSSRAVAGVKRAVGYCDDVEFSPEDAARTELDFLCRGGRSGHRGRRHDGQHPRHRRLRHARPVWAASSHARSACRTSTRR
jgi:2-isopropylmalate synthase